MRKIKVIAILLVLILVCGALCACGNKDDKTNIEDALLMVAAYNCNTMVDGELVVKNPGEYAFVPYGKEISKDNIVVHSAAFDISNLVGVPNVYEFEDGVITGVVQGMKTLVKASGEYKNADGKITVIDGTEVALSEKLLENPEKFYLVYDGWTFFSDSVDGKFGLAQKNDDTVTLYDLDADGVYDYAVCTPIFNALKVIESSGTNLVLNGGYGNASALDIFAEGSNNKISYKRTLSMEALKAGDMINARIAIDMSKPANYNGVHVDLKIVSTCESLAAPLSAVFTTETTDIMTRVNGNLEYWTTTTSSADGENGSKAGRTLMTEANLGKNYRFVYDDIGYIVYAEAVNVDDVDFESLVGYTTLQTANGTQAAGLLDVQGLWHNTKTYSTVSIEINMLKEMGIRRVYVVHENPGYPQFSAAAVGYSTRSGLTGTITGFKAMGFEYPSHAIAEICHNKGMECYAIYKPYEGGGMVTAPTGAKIEEGCVTVQDIFGVRRLFDTFNQETLANGEDYRICRRPDGANDNLEGVVDKITIDFIANGYQIRNNSARRENLTSVGQLTSGQINLIADGKTYSASKQHPYYGINLWISADNNRYALYEGDYKYTYKTDGKVLYDCNGLPMFDGKIMRVITLEITGIEIPEHFAAVTFDNTQYLRTDPLSFMHIWSGDREIVSTSTDFARYVGGYEGNMDNYVWNRDGLPGRASFSSYLKLDAEGNLVGEMTNPDNKYCEQGVTSLVGFPKYGFEFNFEAYPGAVRYNNSVIAIGRGKIETVPGGLCEGYEKVRDYWLSHVETILKGGFDGVAIRLQSHNSIASDYINYGFNEPIVEKYKEIYGEAAYNTLMDPAHKVTEEEFIRIARIRGDFFYLFMEEASELCHKYGAEFTTMLRESYTDPVLSHCQDEFTWWTMPKIVLDWQKTVDLVDFVLIKDYVQRNEDVKKNALVIKEYAQKQGKDVWIQCYDEQGGNFNETWMKNAINDDTVTGFILYELSHVNDYYYAGLKDLLEDVGFKVTFREDRISSK